MTEQASHSESDTGDSLGLWAAVAGFLTTCATAVACVGPLVAILLGVGGFGWLTRYHYLRVPASVLTVLILLAGFRWVYRRPRCPRAPGRHRAAQALLWLATVLAVAVNVFEYVVLPRLV